MKENKGVTGDPKWNGTGELWLQKKGNEYDTMPLWRGEVQIDGFLYTLEGKRSGSDKANAPKIALTVRPKEIY